MRPRAHASQSKPFEKLTAEGTSSNEEHALVVEVIQHALPKQRTQVVVSVIAGRKGAGSHVECKRLVNKAAEQRDAETGHFDDFLGTDASDEGSKAVQFHVSQRRDFGGESSGGWLRSERCAGGGVDGVAEARQGTAIGGTE